MLVVYGLGNNAQKYLQTKHNVGRILIEAIAQNFNLEFKIKKNFAYTKLPPEVTGPNSSDEIILVYSLGFMNSSGIPLRDFWNFFKLPDQTQLLVVHDDSDQIEGSFKISLGGGSGGHNGIQSVYQEILGFMEPAKIIRLKIGIRPEQNKFKSEAFVLSSISKLDSLTLRKIQSLCQNHLSQININNLPKIQNKFNTK